MVYQVSFAVVPVLVAEPRVLLEAHQVLVEVLQVSLAESPVLVVEPQVSVAESQVLFVVHRVCSIKSRGFSEKLLYFLQ